MGIEAFGDMIDWPTTLFEAIGDSASEYDILLALHKMRQSATERLTSTKIGAFAEYYASRNVPVFPILKREKRPAVKGGFHSATTDIDTIKDWWARWPDANIGTPTGTRIGFDVIDVDGPEGRQSLKKRLMMPNPMPEIRAMAITPRDGMGIHLYVDAQDTNTQPDVLPKLDYKAGRSDGTGGGYVLVSPSIGSTGRIYYWITPPKRLASE